MNLLQFLIEIENLKSSLSEEAQRFLEELKEGTKSASILTENGAKILKTMQTNEKEYLNLFTSKQLGELLFMAPRSVSGSMKKLVAEKYVEKTGSNPISYSLTSQGREFLVDNL